MFIDFLLWFYQWICLSGLISGILKKVPVVVGVLGSGKVQEFIDEDNCETSSRVHDFYKCCRLFVVIITRRLMSFIYTDAWTLKCFVDQGVYSGILCIMYHFDICSAV